MKVAYIFIHPFSESPGSSIRVQKLVEGVSKLGIECNIFNPYEKKQVTDDKVKINSMLSIGLPSWLSLFIYNLTRRIYYSKWYFNNPWMFVKGHEMISKRIADQIKSQVMNADVQIIQCVQDVTIPIAMYLKHFVPVPVVADIHNLTHFELVSAGLIKENSPAYNQVLEWDKHLLKQVDLIVAVSDYMKDYIVSEYQIPGNKIIVVPPGGNINRPAPENLQGPPKVVYAGMAAYRENLELYIKSIPLVKAKRPDVQFYMSKKGEEFNKLMYLVQQLGVDISPFWFESSSDFYSFMKTCNVAILPSSNDMARKIGTPLKLFDYLSMGLPIVSNDVGAWTEIIKRENLGLVTESTPQAFAAGIVQLLENNLLAAECGRRGMELVKKIYNWDRSAAILAEGYEMILRNKKGRDLFGYQDESRDFSTTVVARR
jgi:glycosyltransferase involved in cell wall biosynthesis